MGCTRRPDSRFANRENRADVGRGVSPKQDRRSGLRSADASPVAIVNPRARSISRDSVWLPALDTRRNISSLFLAASNPFHGIYYNKCQAYRLGQRPTRCGKNGRLTKRDLLRLDHQSACQNAVVQALRYQACLDSVPGRTRAEVALMFGVSRARVTQYLSILKLPSPITTYIAESTDPDVIRYFTERRLRQLVSFGDDGQAIQRFREMLQEAACG